MESLDVHLANEAERLLCGQFYPTNLVDRHGEWSALYSLVLSAYHETITEKTPTSLSMSQLRGHKSLLLRTVLPTHAYYKPGIFKSGLDSRILGLRFEGYRAESIAVGQSVPEVALILKI